MTVYESKAVTCYGFRQAGSGLFRVIVTVAAQWTDDGRIRLIQALPGAQQGNNPADDLSWQGRTFARPSDPRDAAYFDSVFRLLTNGQHPYRLQTIEEKLTP